MSLDKLLVEHCAPTLASLKTANLFSCRYEDEEELTAAVREWNDALKGKGVELILLRCREGGALIYVCRRSRLARDLRKDGVVEFLGRYGYHGICPGGRNCSNDACGCVDCAIEQLKSRLATADGFPHEIGIFLDYPLCDVRGFIENAGANCKCVGCWKVYGDEREARQRFHKYSKCREVYTRLWHSGTRSVSQLTVRA